MVLRHHIYVLASQEIDLKIHFKNVMVYILITDNKRSYRILGG